MERLSIDVTVPREVAMREGKVQFGRTRYEPTEEDMSTLTLDEKAWLDRNMSRECFALGNALVTWGSVVSAIRAAKAKSDEGEASKRATELEWSKLRAQNDRESAERLELKIVDWLARSDDDLIMPAPSFAVRELYDDKVGYDPRVKARLDHLRAITSKRRDERAEKTAAFEVVCRAYVIDRVPEFRRAAQAAKDVSRPALKHAHGAIMMLLEENGLSVIASGSVYGEPEEHPLPHSHAYDIRDRVADIAPRVLEHPLVQEVALSIVRIDTCVESKCRSGLRSAVRVAVTWRSGDEVSVYVYADTEEPHEHDETEESD